ncbi:hypothetical protein BKA56DRAFT_301796 [Ilyonectria sp. MPI-CAGE-AT-0026]|nr:hypothetical protein BKA56DRAFT_301796 [Ilyonectria sp. MPI-CAGE-AT-0026]
MMGRVSARRHNDNGADKPLAGRSETWLAASGPSKPPQPTAGTQGPWASEIAALPQTSFWRVGALALCPLGPIVRGLFAGQSSHGGDRRDVDSKRQMGDGEREGEGEEKKLGGEDRNRASPTPDRASTMTGAFSGVFSGVFSGTLQRHTSVAHFSGTLSGTLSNAIDPHYPSNPAEQIRCPREATGEARHGGPRTTDHGPNGQGHSAPAGAGSHDCARDPNDRGCWIFAQSSTSTTRRLAVTFKTRQGVASLESRVWRRERH